MIKRQEGKYFCLECEATETSLITGGIQNVTSIWKTACHFLAKLKVLLYDAAIVLIGVYPTDLKIPVHLKPHAMLIAALFYNCQKLNVIKMSFSN